MNIWHNPLKKPKEKSGNPLESYEAKEEASHSENEIGYQENLRRLLESIEGQKLSLILLGSKSLLERIFSYISLHSNTITEENLSNVLDKILDDPQVSAQLGIVLEEDGKKDLKKKILDEVFTEEKNQGEFGDNNISVNEPVQEPQDPVPDEKPDNEKAKTEENQSNPEGTKNNTEVPYTEQILELPEYPTLLALKKDGIISSSECMGISDILLSGVDSLEAIDKYFESREGESKDENNERKGQVKKIFGRIKEEEEHTEEHINKFKTDFGEDISTITSEKGKVGGGKRDEEKQEDDPLIDKVGSHYIELIQSDNPENDKRENMKRAINIEANLMLKGQVTIDRGTEEFKKLMTTIREGNNFQVLLESLHHLQTYIGTANAKAEKGTKQYKKSEQKEKVSLFITESTITQLLDNAEVKADEKVQYGQTLAVIAQGLETIEQRNELQAEKYEERLSRLVAKNAPLAEYKEFLNEIQEVIKENGVNTK